MAKITVVLVVAMVVLAALLSGCGSSHPDKDVVKFSLPLDNQDRVVKVAGEEISLRATELATIDGGITVAVTNDRGFRSGWVESNAGLSISYDDYGSYLIENHGVKGGEAYLVIRFYSDSYRP